MASVLLFLATTLLSPMDAAANSYESTSETVQNTVQLLQRSQGNVADTIKAYEVVADIITEGTGVGGKINYKGIQLERGYVADEDTTLYNPGLSLLTENEKTQLFQAVLDARKAGLAAEAATTTTTQASPPSAEDVIGSEALISSSSSWNTNAELGYEFLRQNLDPWHTFELKGYLKILPWYGAAIYLAVLAVQQFLSSSNNRTPFVLAYFAGVVAVFGPALVLLALGPQ